MGPQSWPVACVSVLVRGVTALFLALVRELADLNGSADPHPLSVVKTATAPFSHVLLY